MDKITLKSLRIFAHHGVFQGEKEVGQTFIVDCDCMLDAREAGMKDDLTKSLHYGFVAEKITQFLTEKTYDLIETAAEQTVHKLFMEYPLVRAMTFTLKKPSAPVGLPLDYPALTISRAWTQAVLALGSNMGNRREHLNFAVDALNALDDVRVLKVSDFIETDPVGYTEQDKFINGACLIETLLTPHELLAAVNAIEADDGRTRDIHWGPRTLDIDIIYYDHLLLNDTDLTIPHALSMTRAFVMEPVMSIVPYYIDPRYNQTVSVVWPREKEALGLADVHFEVAHADQSTQIITTEYKEESPTVESKRKDAPKHEEKKPAPKAKSYELDDFDFDLDSLSEEDFNSLF